MGGEKVIQSISPGIHQPSHCNGASLVIGLELALADVEPGAKIVPDRFLAVGLGRTAKVCEIIRLDAREIVFGLSIDHSKDGVGVGLSVDMSDAPGIARDCHA